MKDNKMKLKYLMFGGIALALAACSDEKLSDGSGNGVDTAPESTLNTAKVTIGKLSQSNVSNVDTWSFSKTRAGEDGHDHSDWEELLNFETEAEIIAKGAVDVTQSNFDKSGSLYYVPSSFTGDLDFNWMNLNSGAKFYNFGILNSLTNLNYGNDVSFYNAGSLSNFGPGSGSVIIYNIGELNLTAYQNITYLYNKGQVDLERDHNPWWPNEGGTADVQKIKINSIGGVINMPDGGKLQADCDIHNPLYVDGNLYIETGDNKYICALEVDGDLLVNGTFTTSYLTAKNIEFRGYPIYLLQNAYVKATEKISMEPSVAKFIGYEDSRAIIECPNFMFDNGHNFEEAFSSNILFNKVTGTITDKYNNSNFSGTLEEYKNAGKVGENLNERFINEELDITPSCGTVAEPEIPETGPKLVLISSVGDHDHNADKNQGEIKTNRLLSATSIYYDNNDAENPKIYVSYHMRGKNWGNDTYDKDEIEGCIEVWSFATNQETNQTEIQLGNYMWTDEFDFNHLILDGSDIVTVGNHQQNGAFIGKIPNNFADFNLSDDEGNTYSSELSYRTLRTDEKLYGDFENESGNVTNQFIDYKNAGDGNCVIKVGEEYFVATFKGYGRVDANSLRSVKNEAGEPQFVQTPYSAKHIINNNGEIAVLYLNKGPEGENVLASDYSTATLATFTTDGFPFIATTTALGSFVQPIDGKNVLAAYDGKYFAAMGKGGLVNGSNIYNFGEKGEEPVNGIDIDDDYIYLASGSHIRVLDHSMNPVAKYNIPYMSANFVKAVEYNGEKYIIVAFGQSGVKVFRLEDKK